LCEELNDALADSTVGARDDDGEGVGHFEGVEIGFTIVGSVWIVVLFVNLK
jgi:hypothetical protein